MPRKPKQPEKYEVEVILAARVNDNDSWDYLVKWWSYPEDDNSWEPQENVKECERLLCSFWDHLGVDEDDEHSLGYQVNAKSAWIKREKEFFARQFAKNDMDDSDTKLQTPQKKSEAKGKTKRTITLPESTDSDNDTERKISITLPARKKRTSPVGVKSSLGRKMTKIKLSTAKQPCVLGKETSNANLDNDQSPPASPDSLFSKESSDDPLMLSPKTLANLTKEPQRKMKLIDMGPSNMSSGSTLSTKRRLFQFTTPSSNVNPVKAKMVPSRPTKKVPLVNLGFKKNLALPPPRDTGTRADHQAKAVDEPLFSEDDNFAGSNKDDIPSPQPPQPDLHPAEERHSTHQSAKLLPPTHPPVEDEAAAVARLDADTDAIAQRDRPSDDSIIYMSELVSESMLNDPVDRRPLMLSRVTPATLPKILKKWKWVGALLDVHGRKLANINLSDETTAPQDRLPFDILLSTADSMTITSILRVGELDIILSACGDSHQLAKLGPDGANDKNYLNSLASFMDSQRQVAVGPLSFEGKQVASLVIFPSTLRDIWRMFDVPNHLQQTGIFVAVAVPWKLPPADCSAGDIRRSLATFVLPDFKRVTSQSIQILAFPNDLRRYLKQPNHPYCVWWSPGDGTASGPGLETKLLYSIMKTCGAKNLKHDDPDVRIVFVHVAALESLHMFPDIVKMRRDRPEVHFYTYGSHPSIPHQQWGVHAIYPLGGVVTFTSGALVGDPTGTAQLIRQISMHPFWDCYLLPSAVGMAVRYLCEGVDPLSGFRDGYLILYDVITLLADGKVSLLRTPQGDNLDQDWLRWQLKLSTLPASGLLEECLSAFSARYANMDEGVIASAVEAEIIDDLLRLQCSYPVVQDYRRFVVIKASDDNRDSDTYSNVAEWITIRDFDTKDGFFQNV